MRHKTRDCSGKNHECSGGAVAISICSGWTMRLAPQGCKGHEPYSYNSSVCIEAFELWGHDVIGGKETLDGRWQHVLSYICYVSLSYGRVMWSVVVVVGCGRGLGLLAAVGGMSVLEMSWPCWIGLVLVADRM